MTYTYGQTHAAMSPAVRIQLAGLEAAVTRKDRTIRELNARLRRRKRAADINHGKPYIDTLSEAERTSLPELWPGDTPDICATRLQAANDESAARASRNISAAQTRRKAA